MIQMKKQKNSMKLLRRMDSDSGRTGRKVVMMKASNGRRKKLQIRGLKLRNICQSTRVGVSSDGAVKKRELRQEEEEETEMALSLSLSLSISSASDHSSENYDVSTGFDEKSCGNDEEKESFTCVSHGMVSVIGRRGEMEDRVRVEEGFMVKGGKKFDFFAVYDGHGGSRVAEACKERLHRVLVETVTENQESFYNDEIVWETVMESCFEKMDEEVNRGRLAEEMMGSTAVVAVVGKEELVVANCGDSRAVLYRGGAVVPLSVDHKMNLVDWFKFFMGSLKTYQKRMKAEEEERAVDFYDKFYAQKPDRPDELQRIEAAGGRVINWYGPRILGVLATSRSIGDQYLEPFVISKPEVTVSHRADSDEFLILASDGLWDVVSNEVACQVVRRCFIGHVKWASARNVGTENRATRAATVLADLAMARGSSDNISVIVIELKKPTSTVTC